MKLEREVRCGQAMRASADSRRVCGYAVRFDEPSEDMGFIEVIKPGAITEETIMRSDIFALLNHDESRVLARCCKGNGSMQIEVREDGIFYSFDAPNTVYGDMLLEHLSRGEISASSFAFTIPNEETAQRWYNENGVTKREINKIDYLYDCSPVYQPAYSTTSCARRSLELMKLEAEEKLIKNIYIEDEQA